MVVRIIMSILVTSLCLIGCQRSPEPVWVWTDGDRLIVVVQDWDEDAYVYRRFNDDKHWEFWNAINAKSPYYPVPKPEWRTDGRKRIVYSDNTEKLKELYNELK